MKNQWQMGALRGIPGIRPCAKPCSTLLCLTVSPKCGVGAWRWAVSGLQW